MTNQELKEMMEASRRWTQERHERAVAIVKEKFPEVEVEGLTVTGNDFEKNFHINNRVYIRVDTINRWAWEAKSQLGITLDVKEKLGHEYTLIDLEGWNRTFLYSGNPSSVIYLETYHTKTGDRVKGERRSRKLHTTTKGQYFEYHGQRVYI